MPTRGGTWLLPVRGGLQVRIPVGIGRVAPVVLEPLANCDRIGPTEKHDAGNPAMQRRFQKHSPCSLLAKHRIYKYPLPLKLELLRSAEAFRVGAFGPWGSVDSLFVSRGSL